jgi:hypothetical protein
MARGGRGVTVEGLRDLVGVGNRERFFEGSTATF